MLNDPAPLEHLLIDRGAIRRFDVQQWDQPVVELPRADNIAGLQRVPDLHVDVGHLTRRHHAAGASPKLVEQEAASHASAVSSSTYSTPSICCTRSAMNRADIGVPT